MLTSFSALTSLLNDLKAGQVALTFRKVSGEVTTRIATLNKGLIPDEKIPVDFRAASDCVTFYSITDNDWRCFKIYNLIEFEKIEPTVERTLWITGWDQDKVNIVDRLGRFAPTSVPRSAIQHMKLVQYSNFHKVYIYQAQVRKSWWDGNVRYYDVSFTGYSNPRRGYRSDD